MITTLKKPCALLDKKTPFYKSAYARLSEVTGIPKEKLEPKVLYDYDSPDKNLIPGVTRAGAYDHEKHTLIVRVKSKAKIEEHEGAHSVHGVLKPNVFVKDNTVYDIHKSYGEISKYEFYACAITKEMSFNLWAFSPVGWNPIQPFYSAFLGPAFVSLSLKNFRKQCKQYGIDGYLAALLYEIDPFKPKKELRQLEARGILEKGKGFTEKGKQEILALKDKMLEICQRKETAPQ